MACGTCGSNTMVINRPTLNSMSAMQCPSSCSSLGVADPLDKNLLGPRKKREKVREQIRDYILLMLGAPVLKIELDEQQIDMAIDWALMIIEDYAPRDFYSYYTFFTSPGKSVYQLPPDVGYIRNVFYNKQETFGFSGTELGGVIPIEYFYGSNAYNSLQAGIVNPISPVYGQLAGWGIFKNYEQMFSRMSSVIGGWELIGQQTGTIKIYPTPFRTQHVIVNYIQKLKDWGQITEAMGAGALIFCKSMLGRIRSRFSNPPGPNGGIQSDGAALVLESREDEKQWKEDLIWRFGEAGCTGITLD